MIRCAESFAVQAMCKTSQDLSRASDMQITLTIVLLAIVIGIGIWFGFQYKFMFKQGLRRGREITGVGGFLGGVINQGGRLMVYFYNPNSALCRIQTLAIDSLQKDFKGIFRVDVSQEARLARQFGVVQTPTIVIIDKGKIEQFFAGIRDEETLRKYLG